MMSGHTAQKSDKGIAFLGVVQKERSHFWNTFAFCVAANLTQWRPTMDSNVTEIRMQQWFELIQAWSSSGVSKRQWCAENGVSPRKFYYWQNQIRKKLYGDMASKKETAMTVRELNLPEAVAPELAASSFAEIPLAPMETRTPDPFRPDVVVKAGGVTIELSDSAARNLLESIGEVIRHAV
jgi:hypothetical protein